MPKHLFGYNNKDLKSNFNMNLIGYNLKGEEIFNHFLKDKTDDELEQISNDFYKDNKGIELTKVELIFEPGKNIDDYHRTIESQNGENIIKTQKFYFNV